MSTPEPAGYLQYARECRRLALQYGDRGDRDLLLEMAKALTELAVENSAPEPDPDGCSSAVTDLTDQAETRSAS